MLVERIRPKLKDPLPPPGGDQRVAASQLEQLKHLSASIGDQETAVRDIETQLIDNSLPEIEVGRLRAMYTFVLNNAQTLALLDAYERERQIMQALQADDTKPVKPVPDPLRFNTSLNGEEKHLNEKLREVAGSHLSDLRIALRIEAKETGGKSDDMKVQALDQKQLTPPPSTSARSGEVYDVKE